MGSRYKTVKGFGYSEMFKDSDDTFAQNLIRTAGAARSTSSSLMGPAMLNINKSLNYRQFIKMDGATVSNIETTVVDETKAMVLVKDPDKLAFVSSATVGGTEGYAHSTAWAKYGDPGWVACPDGGVATHAWSFGRLIGHTPGEYSYTLKFEDCNGIVTDKTEQGKKESAVRITYSKNDGSTGTLIAPSGRVESTEDVTETYTFLSFMLKVNFVEVDDKHTKLLKSTFGIPFKTPEAKNADDEAEELEPIETLEDMMADATVKHIWVSYSAERKGDYISIIDKMLSIGDYGFTSHGVKFVHKKLGMGARLEVDGEVQEITDDQKPQYMIPMEWLKDERNLKEKYSDVENCLKIWVFKEDKIKLKWFQTGLFRILSWVVALVLAYYGQVQMLLGMLTSTAITAVFGGKKAIVLNTIIAIVSFNPESLASNIGGYLNLFSFVAGIATSIAGLYFMSQSEKLARKAENRDEEVEKIQDAIDELSTKNIYWPITEQLDNMYYTIYELPYNLYEQAASVDNFLELPATQT